MKAKILPVLVLLVLGSGCASTLGRPITAAGRNCQDALDNLDYRGAQFGCELRHRVILEQGGVFVAGAQCVSPIELNKEHVEEIRAKGVTP